jgi:hypothetical protein
MQYLNDDCIQALSADTFQQQGPYPWVNIQGTLTPQGFESLRQNLPDISVFERRVGLKRSHGQGYHDRSILHYRKGMKLPAAWSEFLEELQGDAYRSFLRRMFCAPQKRLIFTFEWYYAWQGCGVSPHCDARRKVGTHIFYFNTDDDWDPKWGGDVLILDDDKRFRRHSGPTFDQLRVAASLDPRGNGSLLFQRTAHSWHGVRPLQAPPGHLRKLFLVTINEPTLQVLWRRVRGKDPDGFPLAPLVS